jgi:hypothetical protein
LRARSCSVSSLVAIARPRLHQRTGDHPWRSRVTETVPQLGNPGRILASVFSGSSWTVRLNGGSTQSHFFRMTQPPTYFWRYWMKTATWCVRCPRRCHAANSVTFVMSQNQRSRGPASGSTSSARRTAPTSTSKHHQQPIEIARQPAGRGGSGAPAMHFLASRRNRSWPFTTGCLFRADVANGALRTLLDLQLAPPSRE